jgi:hypothetical protein
MNEDEVQQLHQYLLRQVQEKEKIAQALKEENDRIKEAAEAIRKWLRPLFNAYKLVDEILDPASYEEDEEE